jgi:hypothetical protein
MTYVLEVVGILRVKVDRCGHVDIFWWCCVFREEVSGCDDQFDGRFERKRSARLCRQNFEVRECPATPRYEVVPRADSTPHFDTQRASSSHHSNVRDASCLFLIPASASANVISMNALASR